MCYSCLCSCLRAHLDLLLRTPCCHLRRSSVLIGGRQPANTTMLPKTVVVVAPDPQLRAGMAERHELRLVEALVTQAAVEAHDIAVLLPLARRAVVPLDRSLLRPSPDRPAGQLGAVFAPDRKRAV